MSANLRPGAAVDIGGSGRWNIFDADGVYVCTERAESAEQALAAAQEKHPGKVLEAR